MSKWKHTREELYRECEELISQLEPAVPYYRKLEEKFKALNEEIIARKD